MRLLSFASPFKSSAFKVKLSLGYLVTPEICVSKLSSGYPLFFKHNLKFYTFSLNKSVKHLSLAGVSLLPFTNPVWMPCRWSLCIRRSLSLCSAFMCQESIPCSVPASRNLISEFDVIHIAIGCDCNCILPFL